MTNRIYPAPVVVDTLYAGALRALGPVEAHVLYSDKELPLTNQRSRRGAEAVEDDSSDKVVDAPVEHDDADQDGDRCDEDVALVWSPGFAFVKGPVEDGALVRIHSACLWGDVFQSDHCDCREQLDLSIEMIAKTGSGVLIYMDQEGRGAGLLAKAYAYRALEERGIDTFVAYKEIGIEEDVRDYGPAIEFLKVDLQLRSVKLLTNNPLKVKALQAADMKVDRQPLVVRPGEHNKDYLAAKASVANHIFD